VGRIVRQPVHYLDLTALFLGKDADSISHSMLLACIAEQWPFAAKNHNFDAQKNVAEWIARFFSLLGVDEEDANQSKISKILDEMIKTVQGTPGSLLEKAFKKQSKHRIKLGPWGICDEPQTKGDIEMQEVLEKPSDIVLDDLFGVPARSPDSLEGLDRWENADLESAVTGGRLVRLLQCVASAEEEIRRQAFLILRQLMAIVMV
jgi:hypothetical protein